MKLILGLFLFVACNYTVSAEIPVLRIKLRSAEGDAEKNSPLLQAAGFDAESASSRREGRLGGLFPKLTFDAGWKYLSEVPALSLAGGRNMTLGDNNNYSLGPSLTWTLWDKGALRGAWQAADAAAAAKSWEYKAALKNIRLKTRLAYFQAQLALEQVRLLGDSLKLAQSQYKDIEKRRQAGASSRMDSLAAHQEALRRMSQFRQSRAELAGSLRELFALTGDEPSADLSNPLSSDTADSLPDEKKTPSALISLDPLEDSMRGLARAELSKIDENHPALSALSSMAQSARITAQSISAGRWPKVILSGRSSLDYPNGPVLESFHQNMAGISASFPLFESGRTASEARDLNSHAMSADSRREAVLRDLKRDRLKAGDQLLSLKTQREINRRASAEAEELAGLVYESYKAGRSTFIEVQSANLRELEAKVQSAKTDVQILIQLAVLSSLSKEN